MHIKNIITFLTILLFVSPIIPQQKQPLTLNDIFASNVLRTTPIRNIQWRPDSKAFTFTKRNSDKNFLDIYKHNIKTGHESMLISGSELVYKSERIKMSSYSWTADGIFLLIEGPVKSIWRHSTQAPFYLLNVNTKQISALANNNPHLRNVKLSPDGKYVGFVRDHNIFVVDLSTGKEKAITNNGTDNILNGEFDWVYEEEFGLADAWRWSPDSKKIAYWQFDQTRVKEFNLIDEMYPYNKVFDLKYPKVGEQNAIVKIGVAEIETGNTTWMDIGKNEDIYIPRIFWTNSSSTLSLLRLNRHQNYLEIIMANSSSGKSKVIITDKDSAWIDIIDLIFLKSKDQIILTSEKSGYRHAYLYDYSGKLIKQLTSGEWEISELACVVEEKNVLFFYGKKDSPIEENIYYVNLNGKDLKRISKNNGWHSAIFSPDKKFYVDYYSNAVTPTTTILNNSDGTEVRVLNSGKILALDNHNMVYPSFVKYRTTDGTELNGYFIKPYNFNPKKKYPVLVYGYGGPGSQMVVDRWGGERTFWHQYMTEQGYIIFCTDNRGTGGRGKAFKNLSYLDLSKWSVRDQTEGAKYLATLPYVDKNRIGFWGWSGGGYLTIAMLTREADYFKTGVAVAPVSDFKLYDAIWTERYMGLTNENIDGYKNANLNNTANGLKGKLLIIHGSGDDNVHYQNTLQFINKCIEINKQVDMFIYPNRAHSISGGNTRLHLFTKITDYFLRNL
ncbi:MAG: S9 family peptidase [Ignavibacteriales bacterium CG_4_9_14_3_um_filter_30_11]|nr:MAG: S9 family peptidase [Ignavibacteriales bacterium CG_4_9_14_3_um_filter_30_11]